MRVNLSPRVLDSAVIEAHFICTACRGVANAASLQGGQLKSEGALGVGQDEPTKCFQTIFVTSVVPCLLKKINPYAISDPTRVVNQTTMLNFGVQTLRR